MTSHDRIAKLLVDTGRAVDLPAATEALAREPLQLVLGTQVAKSETLQVAALLAADVGRRAFPAGVVAVVAADGDGLTNWTTGIRLRDSLSALDVRIADRAARDLPTIVIGNGDAANIEAVAVRAVPRGWSGGAVPEHGSVPEWRPGPLGGATAAAIAVSEVFAAVHGASPRAGRRRVGVSTWAPDVNWEDDEAVGPLLERLPASLWLLGLGHLGQAYGWLLRALPYADTSTVRVGLQDLDIVRDENFATQVLSGQRNVGQPKPRVVAAALEAVGIRTTIVERAFDCHQRRQRDEPSTALIGLHDDATRMLLSDVDWSQVINVGLGSRADSFTQILLQRVGPDAARRLFAEQPDDEHVTRLLQEVDAYRQLAETDQCGALIAAGRAVGTAFVGAVAAAMALGEVLRPLHEGPASTTWQLNLRSPQDGAAHMRPFDTKDVPRDFCAARELREQVVVSGAAT